MVLKKLNPMTPPVHKHLHPLRINDHGDIWTDIDVVDVKLTNIFSAVGRRRKSCQRDNRTCRKSCYRPVSWRQRSPHARKVCCTRQKIYSRNAPGVTVDRCWIAEVRGATVLNRVRCSTCNFRHIEVCMRMHIVCKVRRCF